MSNFWNYLAECARFLYWMYFKPYTFEKWLKTIHPDLKPDNHPYIKLVEINLDTLERCNSLRDIIAITEELAWLPSPPPPDIGTILSQFLDISRDVVPIL